MGAYCASRFTTVRRESREVFVGGIGVGANNPIRIQSMTTTNTRDVEATVKQAIALAEAGCEIIRVTAPNKKAAQALKEINRDFRAAGFDNPLVADIHFLPSAAMEAVEHVEKVRVNPGNYADSKKFATIEYTDAQYNEELQRIYDEFSPLVIRSKELGRCMRIGTNHGSLSDRIMNRYGDTPLGMVESALEFLRIAESHSFQDIILSMKASNPKVMIEAYRLLVERMDQEDMRYPLHLGVTEAGDGEDGRIKSAIGIGSLLMDGLGDTIRVSLTEDPVFEIPVAQALANKVMKSWIPLKLEGETHDSIDPYHFDRRKIASIERGSRFRIGSEQAPAVFAPVKTSLAEVEEVGGEVHPLLEQLPDTPIEGIILQVENPDQLLAVDHLSNRFGDESPLLIAELPSGITPDQIQLNLPQDLSRLAILIDASAIELDGLDRIKAICAERDILLILALSPEQDLQIFRSLSQQDIVTLSHTRGNEHVAGQYRRLVDKLKESGSNSPLWIRNQNFDTRPKLSFLDRLLDASILSGSLLCDGLGDIISIETDNDLSRATKLGYNVLQGAGARISKTEFVACPSCGRTLFDLQSTTQRIREKTGHLKGVKIAIMGCIVNGPGEMADADFGYVGGAPAKINLYVGKECVKYNIPQAEADERLIDLIKEHGKWVDPEPVEA